MRYPNTYIFMLRIMQRSLMAEEIVESTLAELCQGTTISLIFANNYLSALL